MNTPQNVFVKWFSMQCVSCGVYFAVGNAFDDRRRQDKAKFYCPNGHGQSYTESEADRLRRERDQLRQNKAYLEDCLRQQREDKETLARRVSAVRGQVTRLKNRAAAGVCPCCNRSFENLRRHMAAKHPDFSSNIAAE